MKKLFYHMLLGGLTLLLSLSSCKDYLDFDYLFKDTILLDSVFMKRDYTEEWLANVYASLSHGQNVMVAAKGKQPFNFLGDDMYFGDWLNDGDSYAWYKNCQYDEGKLQDSWEVNYQAIRNASVFIHNVDKNMEMTADEILDNKGQARFLRAYFYWLLMRKYGPIPILPDEGLDYTLAYEDLAVARNTYEECAEFIATEMAQAAQEMTDIPRNNLHIARATPGAALAMRARAYIYAASPLFNGNQDAWAKQLVNDQGEPLLNLERKEELWAKAAAAAKEVMDLGIYELHTVKFRELDGGPASPKSIAPPEHPEYSFNDFPNGWQDIDPFESYREVFNGALKANNNPEMIFSRVSNVGEYGILIMVLHQMPRSLNGWNCHGVTMKQANTYYMADGTDYYAYGKEDPRIGRPDYGYTESDDEVPFLKKNVSLEFAGREPRYYASIAFNGSYWETLDVSETTQSLTEEQRQVFYYRGTQDGFVSGLPDRYLLTGIGIKKFVHQRDYFISTTGDNNYYGPDKIDVDLRYAEILLIYAEALNELTGSFAIPDYKGESIISVSRNIEEMRKGIKPIRMRAGVPDFTSDVYGNADSFRKALKRERQIELFAECHRYYDLRRWKDAPKEETDEVWGYNTNMTVDQKETFHIPMKIPSLPAVFIDKMYLWPIRHSELKRNPKLTQNPGWRYYD